jgi:hypothetical protein
MALRYRPPVTEDSPPNEPAELSTIPPAPEVPDTDPVESPAIVGIQRGIDAMLRQLINIELKLDSVDKKVDNSIDVSRSARSAAELATDQVKAVARILDEKVCSGLAELDRKLEHVATRLAGTVDSLANIANAQGHVLSEHQRRLDELEDAQPHLHAVNGNGAAE